MPIGQHVKEVIFKQRVQFSKFIFIGIINTLIGYGIFTLLTYFNSIPFLALLFTYMIAVPINYLTTGRFVFAITNFKVLVPFIVAYIIIYFINLVALHVLIFFGIKQIFAQAILLPFIAILSFVIFQQFVFRKV